MASIADVFFRALLDDKQLQVDAIKSGDKAGETLGGRMSKGISGALRVGLAGLGAVAGLATKGLAELDDVQRQFAADTGASTDEAKAAGKAILEMSRRNLQPMAQIGGALGKVHTDLGLTGDAAVDTTEKFLKFATVTKRDAAEEVSAFDDILDSYGKTAADIPGIMDKLIASHQKYGGAIADDEAALAAMAPQLKAFNLGIDDGIALLDLFKSSGLDAAQIPKALNAALQKLDGRPLSDVVTELAGIEDPSKRAARSVEIFGSKAGVALANAIKPGVHSLDDFKISAEDAAGATKDASDQIEGSFGNRFQLLLKNLGGAALEAGQNFGPLLTGIASLASLAGAVGLDTVLAKLVGMFAKAGAAAGGAFIDAAGTATGAAGTIIGNTIAQPLIDALDPDKNSLLGRGLRRGAALAGALWGVIFGAASKIAEVLSALFMKLPGSGLLVRAITSSATKLGLIMGAALFAADQWANMLGSTLGGLPGAAGFKAGLSKLGGFIGSNLGGIAAGAFAIALWVEVVNTYNKIKSGLGEQLQGIGKDVANQITSGSLDQLKQSKGALEKGIADLGTVWDLGIFTNDARDNLQTQLDAVNAEIEKRMQVGVDGAAGVVQGAGPKLSDAWGYAIQVGGRATEGAVAKWFRTPLLERLVLIGHDARIASAQAALQIASGFRDARSGIDAALKQLHDDIKNKLTPSKEIGVRVGELLSRDIVRGLRSADPVVKAQAEGTRQLVEDQLIALVQAGGKTGKDVLAELQKAMHSKDPNVRDQAKRTKTIIDDALKSKSAPKTPGDQIVDGLTSDIYQGQGPVGRAAYTLGRQIARNVLAGVKDTGYVAPAATGGGGFVRRLAEGTDYVPADQLAYIHQGEMVVPRRQADAIRGGEAVLGAGGTTTYQTTLVMPAPPTRDPLLAIERASFYQRSGLLNPRLRPSGA